MTKPYLLVGLGVLSWVIPFLVSVPLVSRTGEPVIDVITFKTVMLLVGAIVGAVLFAYYVPQLDGNYLTATVTAGIVWFVINVVLDVIVLVVLFGTPLDEWVVQTGARYLIIPIQAAAIGYIVANI